MPASDKTQQHLHQPSQSSEIYLGVMSGTSLDGIDVVAVSFAPKLQILAACSYPMPKAIKQLILQLCASGDDEIEKLGHLDIALGRFFAKCCNQLIDDNSKLLPVSRIIAIGSHGQTIRHRPANAPKENFSLQIGDPNTLAEHTKLLTVADFRRRDVAAGGQGAPLVPAFHRAIFQSLSSDRVILNIGGMANLTLLAKDKTRALKGFDTGPGNVLMDAWIHQQKALDYDKNGDWASEGKVNNALLTQLLALPFFSLSIPKSTGREQFNLAWLEQSLTALGEPISAVDVQTTLVELTATSIVNEITQHHFNRAQVYVCGGGAHNGYLLHRLKQLLPAAQTVQTTRCLNLDPDWVEATAFAWLAKQTLAGLTSNCPTVTGASGERILGAIFQA